jgi:hypothetical protein
MDVEQHKKDLENLIYLSQETQKKELSRLFGENTFLFKLKEYLGKSVNAKISYKMKDRYNNERMYFALREKIEEDFIKDENWYSYFKDSVSIQELEDVIKNPIVDFDPRTLTLIVIETLKRYVDNGEELNPKCLLLQKVYLFLQSLLLSYIPNYPQTNGFAEYLKTKQHRIDLEDARLTGSVCPSCSSTDVKSYGANWKCKSCGREFRKARKKEED